MKSRVLLTTTVICILFMCYACKSTKATLVTVPEKNYLFPLEWIGHYEGELTIFGIGSDTTKVDMQLTIGSPDATGLYPWVLQYGEKDKRYYGLEVINAEKGHYLIDEYNSIKLDAYLRGNHFISRFEVSNNDLIFHYEKDAVGINISVYASSATSISETGGEIIASDTIPSVSAFPMYGYQKALLKKVER